MLFDGVSDEIASRTLRRYFRESDLSKFCLHGLACVPVLVTEEIWVQPSTHLVTFILRYVLSAIKEDDLLFHRVPRV